MFWVGMPIADEMQSQSMSLLNLSLLRDSVRHIGIPRSPVSPARTGRLDDGDLVICKSREELTASLTVKKSALLMTAEVRQHLRGENEFLAGRSYQVARHVEEHIGHCASRAQTLRATRSPGPGSQNLLTAVVCH